MKKYMRRALCIMMAAVLSMGSFSGKAMALNIGGTGEAQTEGSNSSSDNTNEENSNSGVEVATGSALEEDKGTVPDEKEEDRKGIEVDITTNEGGVRVKAKKSQVKKKGKAYVQKILDECKVDRSLYDIICTRVIFFEKDDYIYKYKLRWKYNTSDDNFKKYSRNCREVMKDICDHDAENSYYAKKYESKRKKVNKDKYIQLTVRCFEGVSGMNAVRLATELKGKSVAYRQKVTRENSLTHYGLTIGADGNGLVGVYGDASFHELCNADNMPVSLNSHVTGVIPLTKVRVLYDYPNGWSLVKFYSEKSLSKNAIKKSGTYFVRTKNLSDTKKDAVPVLINSTDDKKDVEILSGFSYKYVENLRKKLTARERWIIRFRAVYLNTFATDELLDYYYKHYDGALNDLRSNSYTDDMCWDNRESTLSCKNVLIKLNGKYRNITYWTSTQNLAGVRDYLFTKKGCDLYNLAGSN